MHATLSFGQCTICIGGYERSAYLGHSNRSVKQQMDLSKIDLNLFTVFDAIYREGGITSASKRLHLSQPAVSHALARLRELLNDPLFERHGNEMIPTPRARTLATTIGGSLENIEQMLHRAAEFDPLTSKRSFAIAMREAHEIYFLPRMMSALKREAPNINIATVRIERRDLEDDLQAGVLDCAVDMALPASMAVFRKAIASESLVVLARQDHPIIRGTLNLETYLEQEHVLITGRRRGGGYEDSALSRLGISRRIRIRCQQHVAASEVVKHSDLLATMPQSYAELANRHTDNQVLPFPTAIPMFDLFLYWHANVDEDSANQWFRRQVQAVLGRDK
jgi:DNA-binding transcriptional LysR family regulator